MIHIRYYFYDGAIQFWTDDGLVAGTSQLKDYARLRDLLEKYEWKSLNSAQVVDIPDGDPRTDEFLEMMRRLTKMEKLTND